MKVQLQLATNWKFFLPMGVALISLLWSVFNFIMGKITFGKLTQNDLLHLTKDVEELKEEEKDFKKEIKEELHRVFLAIKRIEKKQIRRDAICEERHSKDK
jgi:hypothetical protein